MPRRNVKRKIKKKSKIDKKAIYKLIVMLFSVFLMIFSIFQVYFLAKYTFGLNVSKRQLYLYRLVSGTINKEKDNEN